MPDPSRPIFESLIANGYQVEFHSHATAILLVDFPEAVAELENALLGVTIPIEEIIAGGGGEAKGTQRLRRALNSANWLKTKFTIKKTVNERERESISHEIDHVREFPAGTVALEIEWNNKDPFFDRDLENFKRLHVDSAISVGIVVTRGATLQDSMKRLVRRFVDDKKIDSHDDMDRIGLNRTRRQIADVMKRV